MHLSAEVPNDFGDYIEQLARKLWEEQALEQGYDPVLIQTYGERLSEAIKKGYGKDYIDTDFNTPDYKKLYSLEKNVWQFSAAKTYTQLKQMSDALTKPDGSLRSFDEFRIQTVIITGEQLRHLKTEYQTAVAGAQMAAKWDTIQAQKHIYPYLEFIAIEDEHTTALCRSLDGVIRPVDDAFWMQFYPPNHYNCRSTVKQRRNVEVTHESKIAYPNIPSIFKVNLGQRGLAFPEDHAYFEDMPPEVMEASRQFFPYNMQFDILDASNNTEGIIRRHYMVDTESADYDRLLKIAIDKTVNDKIMVDIMPTLDPDGFAAQRAVIFPDAKPNKSPDLRIDKVLYEEESSTRSFNSNNIKHAIGEGSKQADYVIINLSEEVDKIILDRLANGRWKDHKHLKLIEFRFNDEVWVYKRP